MWEKNLDKPDDTTDGTPRMVGEAPKGLNHSLREAPTGCTAANSGADRCSHEHCCRQMLNGVTLVKYSGVSVSWDDFEGFAPDA
jgi:hypothetical protein